MQLNWAMWAKAVSAGGALALLAATLTGCGSSPSATTESTPASLSTLTPGQLKVCLYPGFAPVAYPGADGQVVGTDVTYLSEFAARNNLAYTPVVVNSFDNIWMRPTENQCDVAASGIASLAIRESQTGTAAVWSANYYRTVRSFNIRPGDTLDSVQQLAGRTVIVTKGSTADIDLRSRLARAGITNTKIRYTDDDIAAANRVAQGTGPTAPFAYGSGLVSTEWLVDQVPGVKVAWPHCLMLPNGQLQAENFSYVVRAASTGVADALNSFIASEPYPGAPPPNIPCPN